MTLDGWSLNNKIDKLRDEIQHEMRELKINFAMLYDYLKQAEAAKKSDTKKKTKKTVKN
tara:strand:- start:2298 stop:2474 length:177 start_codon:yes stop_codon:yes gene_type:complete